MSIPFEITNPSGDLIRGDLHLPSKKGGKPVPVAVICHGFKGFKDWGFFPYLAESLAHAGFAAVRFNFSHNGVSTDFDNFTCLEKFSVNTIGKEIEDLRAVLAAIAAGKLPEPGRLDPTRLALLAHSRGSASTLLVGPKEKQVKVLATWAGLSTLDRWPDAVKEEWRRTGEVVILNTRTSQEMPMKVSILEEFEAHREDYDILKAVRNLEIPYLVIHGDEDETVPFEEGSLLHDNTPRGLRRFQIVPGAGHSFGAVHPFVGTTPDLEEAIRVTLDWFQARV
jgi:pimeloyl-ACP methyl ester carboxylesterase